jgi:bifunctional non-homologous end joining protein LigD
MLFGRNGGDFTRRFPRIAAAVLGLPTRSCVIDGELIAAGRHGQPDFLALLHGRHVPTCVYCFDLLEHNGRDLREQPLVQRRARLQALLRRAKSDLLRFSASFPDANALLAECSRRGLEGIVAKRKDAPYRSGTRSGWVKVKNVGVEGREPIPQQAIREAIDRATSPNHSAVALAKANCVSPSSPAR